jgi:hypothetical protein
VWPGDIGRGQTVISNAASDEVAHSLSNVRRVQHQVIQPLQDKVKPMGHFTSVQNLAIEIGEEDGSFLPVGRFLLQSQSDQNLDDL